VRDQAARNLARRLSEIGERGLLQGAVASDAHGGPAVAVDGGEQDVRQRRRMGGG
jgi:hypothetical protein